MAVRFLGERNMKLKPNEYYVSYNLLYLSLKIFKINYVSYNLLYFFVPDEYL